MSPLDRLIARADGALRVLAGVAEPARPSPAAAVPEATLDATERRHVAGLMRVNHAGEICAQALYEGQALAAEDPRVRNALHAAAAEERDHLLWCRQRLRELDASPSLFDPLWYAGSFALGAAVGLLGDRSSLGFVEATEDRVVQHLAGHEAVLPPQDARSRAVLAQMRADEQRHGDEALAAGGVLLPEPVKRLMALTAKLMTTISYRI